MVNMFQFMYQGDRFATYFTVIFHVSLAMDSLPMLVNISRTEHLVAVLTLLGF